MNREQLEAAGWTILPAFVFSDEYPDGSILTGPDGASFLEAGATDDEIDWVHVAERVAALGSATHRQEAKDGTEMRGVSTTRGGA